MREMTDRLAEDADLAARYAAAHEDYLRRRAVFGEVPEIEGISAGGMPTRVKCLHAHYAWFLAGGDDPVGRWVDEQLHTPVLREDVP